MSPEDALLKTRDEEIALAADHIEYARILESTRLEFLIWKELVR